MSVVDIELDNEIDSSISEDEEFFPKFVEYSRANQVANEEQACVVMAGVATGLLGSWKDYLGVLVTGGSSSGKTHMIREVIKSAFDYVQDDPEKEWWFELSGGSDKAAIDDEELDDAQIAYFNELNKIPDEMKEFIKSVVEDGGFRYGRNVPDSEKESGRDTKHIERDPLSVLFCFADENEYQIDQELRTRLVEVKVDESEEKNKAVHRMKWGAKNISLSSSPHTYVYDDDVLEHEIKDHINNIPMGMNVVIPTDDGMYDVDDWFAAEVVEPMLTFKRSQATRASAMMASLCKGSALLNYHKRPRYTDEDGDEYIVATKQDVANLISWRQTLLALTHGLTEKKFAIVDAILEHGAQANQAGTKVQAELESILDGIQENHAVGSMKKSTVRELLNEMDEHYIIDKKNHPDDGRKNIYVYDGGKTLSPPEFGRHYDDFAQLMDPIRDQPVTETVTQQQRRFGDKMGSDVLKADTDAATYMGDPSSGNSTLDTGTSLSERQQAVADAMKETMDKKVIPTENASEDGEAVYMATEHMVGVSPVDSSGETVVPERPPNGSDKSDESCLMNPSHELWASKNMNFSEVKAAIKDTIGELKAEGVFDVEETDDGLYVRVDV